MTECPHGNLADERCAQCVADGQRQPGEHNQRRYTDPDRVQKQTAADDNLAYRSRRQLEARIAVRVARAAAQWSREHGQAM